MNSRLGQCRSCQAWIRWVETEKGKPMPLDVDPVSDGNVTVEVSEARRGPVARVWGKPGNIPEGVDRFKSHHATCPQGREWRRG